MLLAVVDQSVVGARGWSASGRLLGHVDLNVCKVVQIILNLEVGQSGTRTHLVPSGVILVLLAL